MKLILDERIVREVIDTLYMARTTLLGITGLDSPQEVAKKSANETAITRRISKAIDIIQQSEQPSKDLEEAAWKYAEQEIKTWDDTEPNERKEIHDDFIAGAKWQAEHTEDYPMPEDTVLFQKGVEEGKRLIMEDAVDARVVGVYPLKKGNDVQYAVMYPIGILPHKDGDKVKVIIIKEKEFEGKQQQNLGL